MQQQKLMHKLEKKQIPYWTIVGCSPDLTYREPSLLIDSDKITALELALSFEQNAIFWIEEQQLWLIPCCMQGQTEVALGSFTDRLIELNK